ncbi:MAG TPA: ATP-binding protein [Candidatus Deferrimicrobium sp.]|nr:ATP-binding protein [Candidatus Deferrimicrobium sp.]
MKIKTKIKKNNPALIGVIDFRRMNKIIFFWVCLLVVAVHLCFSLGGQVTNTPGYKYLENYSPHKENDFQPQNWAVLQDKRGLIYTGNQGGILEFDGVSWRLIEIPNRSVRSLAMDAAGTIYVGGDNEIGFLAPDANGTLRYVSLIDYLTGAKKNFSRVWYTYSNREGIYFMTSKFLFRWDPAAQQIKTWETAFSFSNAFICNDIFFVCEKKVGLKQMKEDTLQLVRGGETFADLSIEMLVPYDSRNMLIGTRSKGFYLYNGLACQPFPTEVDNYLKEKILYHGIHLSAVPGQFAAATLRGGLVIFDANGRLIQIFDKTSGLQDDSITYVFEEPEGNLWLTLSKGISRLEYASPISVYDDRSGLPGIAMTICVIKPANRDIIYAGTTGGLFYLSSAYKFRHVDEISRICWSLLPYGDGLLAAATDGVFRVETGFNTANAEPKNVRKIIDIPSYALDRSNKDPNRIWVGTANGLVSLYLNLANQWTREFQFENITEDIKTIVEDKKANLWLGTLNQGIIKVDFSGPQINRYALTHYNAAHGLPAGGVNVFTAAGHILFATEKGLYRFDETNKRFIPDATLGKTYAAEGQSVFRIAEGKNQDIWFHSRCRNLRAISKPGGSYDIDAQPFLRIPPAQVNSIYPGPDGRAVWFAGVDGLVRCDTTMQKNYAPRFSACIRKVLIGGKRLLFDGYMGSHPIVPELKYGDRNLQIDFAAPFFEEKPAALYQVLMEGYDENWSGWGPETRKDYTNLDPGFYTFRVRAKNIYGGISDEAVFRFKLLSPWYHTWWAYTCYTLAAFLMLFFIVRWRSQWLVREKQKLELIIKENTAEIEGKNRLLEKQAQQVKEMDKVKSRFFANISHEFRTPLTLILGPLEQMLTEPQEKEIEQKKKMRMMLRNSRRLLGLINQLLELSKFDSGSMKLQAMRQNIVPFLKGIFHSFDSLAVQKEVALIFQSETENIPLYYDPERLEEVISNLLANAAKFTPAGGKITLAVKVKQDFLEVSVSDTGPGIPREELAHIFDRFYQADNTYAYHRQGTGIGLAIAREVVELHHGLITVHSPGDEGVGSQFVIRLPLGDSHLKPGEIAASFPPPKKLGIPDPEMKEDGDEEFEFTEKGAKNDRVSTGHEKDIILVVEDNADVRQYIRSALESEYTVKEAANGAAGLRQAGEIIPDLIICDIMMPGMDGFEVCRILKNQIATSHIPVILLTAKAAEENIIQGLETGADDYITKPFSTRILLARIKNLVDLRRQLQQTFNREMTMQPSKAVVSRIDQEFLEELQQVIEANLDDPEFNVDQFSQKLYLSHSTLYRKINALTGETPTDFLQSYRLKRGAELLRKGKLSILEVALEVGFSSANYFTKCFKKKFHQLPSECQAEKRDWNDE